MSASEWTNWLFWIGGGGIGLLALALLYWSLFRDRARGRRRCLKCWYDMSQSPTLTCSECGWTAKRERKLVKTRRRWRWACTAFFLGIVSTACMYTPKVRSDGWVSIVPTTILIVVVPEYADCNDPLALELERRLPFDGDSFPDVRNRIWDWQWRLLIRRCIAALEQDRGFPRRFPINTKRSPTPSRYAEFVLEDCYDSGAIDALGMFDEVRHALPNTLRPAIRDHWPSDTPLQWRVEGGPSYGFAHDSTMTATAVNGAEPPSWISRNFVPKLGFWVSENETVTADGDFEIVFHIDHRVNAFYRDSEQFYGSNDVTTRVHVGGSIDGIVRGVRSVELDEQIRRHTTTRVGKRVVILKMSPELLPTLQTMSLALKIDVLADEQIISTTNTVIKPEYFNADGTWSGRGVIVLSRTTSRDIDPDSELSIRLTGDQMGALIHSDFDSYWAGEIEIPVDTTWWQRRQ